MMRVAVLGGLILLSGCGGGGTTGTNYSDAPPMAEIVGTPAPKAAPTPMAEPEAITNVAEDAAPANEVEATDAVEVTNAVEDTAP